MVAEHNGSVGFWRRHAIVSIFILLGPSVRRHQSENRPSVTELPGLTSDPIVYGGPQGWNPHQLHLLIDNQEYPELPKRQAICLKHQMFHAHAISRFGFRSRG